MALCVCSNMNEDFSVFIKELLSNEYLIFMFCLTKWLIPIMLSQFWKDLISFGKVDIEHKFFFVRLHKLILKKLIWLSWQEILPILQMLSPLAVLVLPDFGSAQALIGGPQKVR